MMIQCSVHVADGESVHQFFQLFHLCDDQKTNRQNRMFQAQEGGIDGRRASCPLGFRAYGLWFR
jgi:hypothetical protein